VSSHMPCNALLQNDAVNSYSVGTSKYSHPAQFQSAKITLRIRFEILRGPCRRRGLRRIADLTDDKMRPTSLIQTDRQSALSSVVNAASRASLGCSSDRAAISAVCDLLTNRRELTRCGSTETRRAVVASALAMGGRIYDATQQTDAGVLG